MSISMKPLSADASEFVPRAAAAAPVGIPLTFTVYRGLGAPNTRHFGLHPMAAPRTDAFEHGVLHWVGKQVRGYEHPYDAADYEDDTIEHGCHDNDYRLDSIVRPMPGVAAAPLGDFPNNIKDYFWLNDGKNDENPWYMLARLSNGTFVFLAASCNFSGFDCQGQIHLYAATDLQTLYDNGVPEAARFLFACCFDKATREKVAADKKARAAAAAAARRPKPSHLRQAAKMQQAQAQQALQAKYTADAQQALAQVRQGQLSRIQVKTAHDAAFKILEERMQRWQAMSDSDHEREEERYEAFRDRMRDKYPGGRHGW